MLGSVILIALNVLGTLWLESTLTRYYRFEFAVVVLLLLFGMILITAEMKRLRWAWPMMTIYFALSTLNIAFLFLITSNFLGFALTALITIVGLLRAVSHLDDPEVEELDPIAVKLETYGNYKKKEPLYVDPVLWIHPDDLLNDFNMGSVKKTTRASRKKTVRRLTAKKRKSAKKKAKRKSSRKRTVKRKASKKKTSSKKKKRNRRKKAKTKKSRRKR